MLMTSPLLAAPFSVNGTLEPAEIVIGDQAVLHYEVYQDASDRISMPVLADTVVAHVDIVGKPSIDTVRLDGGRIQVNVDYTVTSFDSGFYYIPSQRFESVEDVAESRPMSLSVLTVEIDAESDDINDIKDVMDAPFSWREFFKWMGIVLAVLLVIAIIAYLVYRFVLHREVPILAPKPEPEIPAHVVALARLEEIKAEKLWQSGKVKEFYTELTDVLREYIDKRFGINAMEMTSDEIIALVRKNPDMDEVRASLAQILELSDLVKFAKLVPMENENSRSVLDAFAFVEKTVPAEPVADEEGKEDTK